jgi:di/tricarboxylate transporter
MEQLIEEFFKGVFKALGYLLVEIFFSTLCYWVGWPVCKLMTLGKYPTSKQIVHIDYYQQNSSSLWCSVVGFLVLLLICVYIFS